MQKDARRLPGDRGLTGSVFLRRQVGPSQPLLETEQEAHVSAHRTLNPEDHPGVTLVISPRLGLC